MKITRFDRSLCQAVRRAVEEAISAVGKDFGLSIKTAGGTFSSESFAFKVEATVLASDGTAKNEYAENYKTFCKQYGLKPEELGAKVTFKNTVFEIYGIAPQSYKFPILLKNTRTGKIWKYPSASVEIALGRKPTTQFPESSRRNEETGYED